MNKHKDQIIKLRLDGKSYDEIQKELGCSKGTIAYHCGEGQKEKYANSRRKNRATIIGKLRRKIDNFKLSTRLILKKIQNGKDKFYRGDEPNIDLKDCNFTLDDILKKIEEYPFCYLTGRPIDIDNPDSISFDHVIPRSKGGDNSFDNLKISCIEANYSKRDLFLEEYIQLCKEVLINFGYTVEK